MSETQSFMSLAFSEMLPTPHLLISLFHTVFDDLFGTYSHHLRFVLLTFSAMSTNHHLLLIFPCHDKCVMVSLISYYYMSNPFQFYFPPLLCDVCHSRLLRSSFHNVYGQLSFISYVFIPLNLVSLTISVMSTVPYFLISSFHIFWYLHSIMSLTSCPSSLMCSYHLTLLPSPSQWCLSPHVF